MLKEKRKLCMTRKVLLEMEARLDSHVRQLRNTRDTELAHKCLEACNRLERMTLESYRQNKIEYDFVNGQKEYLDNYRNVIKKMMEVAL